ncbi:MAG TPA: HAD family phosphatase [bacterium]|jgi:HAD superfamily hydrolase (TIGR01490 family)|nr:HAD family phosphatase [bacterium]HOG38491.1 HAD family phosphatase [bacterium]
MQKSKKIAVFDIDGTIFRSSLLIELVNALIQEGLFSQNVKNTYTKAYKKWSNREGSYEDYINAVVKAFEKNIPGMNYKIFKNIAKKVVSNNRDMVYRYTRDLFKELKKKNYYLLAISHSPKEIVQDFTREWGFDSFYGRVYEVSDNKFTGKTLHLDLISDKSKMLKYAIKKENLTLNNSIGVGDSESDISLLKMVEKPICFNPNKKLYTTAKRLGWKIVVERKDVIYNL